MPSPAPSAFPSSEPSHQPSAAPTISPHPSAAPSPEPSLSPEPSEQPTSSEEPSEVPTGSEEPSEEPSISMEPTVMVRRVRVFADPFVLQFRLQDPTRSVDANDVNGIIPLTEQFILDQLRLTLGNRPTNFNIRIWRGLNVPANQFFWEITVSELIGLFPPGSEPSTAFLNVLIEEAFSGDNDNDYVAFLRASAPQMPRFNVFRRTVDVDYVNNFPLDNAVEGALVEQPVVEEP